MLWAIKRRVPAAARRGHQIGRAFDAQARIARERIAKAGRIKDLRQIGELVDDRFRAGRTTASRRAPASKTSTTTGSTPCALSCCGFAGGPRRAGHLVPGSKQKWRQPPSDRAARSGKENPHVDLSHAFRMTMVGLRSNRIVGASRIEGSTANAIGRNANRAMPVKSHTAPQRTETRTVIA